MPSSSSSHRQVLDHHSSHPHTSNSELSPALSSATSPRRSESSSSGSTPSLEEDEAGIANRFEQVMKAFATLNAHDLHLDVNLGAWETVLGDELLYGNSPHDAKDAQPTPPETRPHFLSPVSKLIPRARFTSERKPSVKDKKNEFATSQSSQAPSSSTRPLHGIQQMSAQQPSGIPSTGLLAPLSPHLAGSLPMMSTGILAPVGPLFLPSPPLLQPIVPSPVASPPPSPSGASAPRRTVHSTRHAQSYSALRSTPATSTAGTSNATPTDGTDATTRTSASRRNANVNAAVLEYHRANLRQNQYLHQQAVLLEQQRQQLAFQMQLAQQRDQDMAERIKQERRKGRKESDHQQRLSGLFDPSDSTGQHQQTALATDDHQGPAASSRISTSSADSSRSILSRSSSRRHSPSMSSMALTPTSPPLTAISTASTSPTLRPRVRIRTTDLHPPQERPYAIPAGQSTDPTPSSHTALSRPDSKSTSPVRTTPAAAPSSTWTRRPETIDLGPEYEAELLLERLDSPTNVLDQHHTHLSTGHDVGRGASTLDDSFREQQSASHQAGASPVSTPGKHPALDAEFRLEGSDDSTTNKARSRSASSSLWKRTKREALNMLSRKSR